MRASLGIANLFGPGAVHAELRLAIRPEPGLQLPGAPFLLAAVLLLAAT